MEDEANEEKQTDYSPPSKKWLDIYRSAKGFLLYTAQKNKINHWSISLCKVSPWAVDFLFALIF